MTDIIPVPKPSKAHSELQRDLERYLVSGSPPWIIFKEMDLTDEMYPFDGVENPGLQRADLYAISWRNPVQVCIYECKVSRSDFQRDVRSGKYLGYLEHCNLFYFATPYGLITKDEVPEGCGWIQQNKQHRRFRVRSTGDLNRSYKPSVAQLLACVKKKEKTGWGYNFG